MLIDVQRADSVPAVDQMLIDVQRAYSVPAVERSLLEQPLKANGAIASNARYRVPSSRGNASTVCGLKPF